MLVLSLVTDIHLLLIKLSLLVPCPDPSVKSPYADSQWLSRSNKNYELEVPLGINPGMRCQRDTIRILSEVNHPSCSNRIYCNDSLKDNWLGDNAVVILAMGICIFILNIWT